MFHFPPQLFVNVPYLYLLKGRTKDVYVVNSASVVFHFKYKLAKFVLSPISFLVQFTVFILLTKPTQILVSTPVMQVKKSAFLLF